MTILRVTYSEDFRVSAIASKIYALLRDRGFDPFRVTLNYYAKIGEQEANFHFNNSDKLENEKSKLEEILRKFKIKEFSLI